MSRFIINIDPSVSDEVGLELVNHVISRGKISEDGLRYCYATVWPDFNIVLANLTKAGTHTFIVYQKGKYKEGKEVNE